MYGANKSVSGLQRPSGLMVAGGELLWVEQDAGELRKCRVSVDGPVGCLEPATSLLSGLNCPQDFAIDYARNLIYVLQYGGGDSVDIVKSAAVLSERRRAARPSLERRMLT